MKKKKNLEILLIQPDSPFLLIPNAFPSLGLLYVSSYLKKNGYSPDFFDLTGGGKLPDDLKADIFGFSSQITQFREVISMKNELKKKNPNSLFVIGGPFPTHSPKECLDAGFDIVVQGEGEIPMLKIADKYPNKNEKIMFSNEFIDPNFFPDWEAINPLDYKYQLEGKRCINIMTRRGNCPFRCTFCARQEVGRSPLRFREVNHVLDEIKFLKEKYGFGAVAIYDDDVLINKKRDKQIFKGLHDLDMPYRCMTRSHLANKEDLKFLKDTGCSEICVGVESADPYILEQIINKGTTVEQNTKFIENCHDIGLRVRAYLMIGLPSESKKTISRTRKWIKKVKLDNYDLFTFTPYPGSEIYKNKNKYEIDWNENQLRKIWFTGGGQYGNSPVWTPYLSSKEISNLKKEIDYEFKRGKGGVTDYWGPIKD